MAFYPCDGSIKIQNGAVSFKRTSSSEQQWVNKYISFPQAFKELPLVSVVNTSAHSVENCLVNNRSKSGFSIALNCQTAGFDYSVEWMAIGRV